eukprot:g50415.t1
MISHTKSSTLERLGSIRQRRILATSVVDTSLVRDRSCHVSRLVLNFERFAKFDCVPNVEFHRECWGIQLDSTALISFFSVTIGDFLWSNRLWLVRSHLIGKAFLML